MFPFRVFDCWLGCVRCGYIIRVYFYYYHLVSDSIEKEQCAQHKSHVKDRKAIRNCGYGREQTQAKQH